MSRARRPGLDTIRGLTLLSMMAYHACWDLVYLFHCDWAWYRSFGAYLWQQSICWTFILLSGYCVSLGRHPLRRGLITLAAGAVVIEDVPANAVVAGCPARIIKMKDEKTTLKTALEDTLRKL